MQLFGFSGTFGNVEHVLLVGTAGAVRSSLKSHGRIKVGDVIATSGGDDSPAYVYVNNTSSGRDDELQTRTWTPKGKTLRRALQQVERKSKEKTEFEKNWRKNQENIKQQLESNETENISPVKTNAPSVHFGAIGAGKHLAENDDVKKQVRAKFNVFAVDCGFQAVMESLEGNRKEDFALVRVASDWCDGLESRARHAEAALRAAVFARLLVLELPRPKVDSDEED